VLLDRDEVAPDPGVEAAALRELVVLDADAGAPGALELAPVRMTLIALP
jgi:hypothetical protein